MTAPATLHAAPTIAPQPAARPIAPAVAARIDRCVEQLADPDANVRERAAASLVEIGWTARPAVKAAAASANVQRRSLARSVLAKLPLHAPGDPRDIRDALRSYQSADPKARARIALSLLANDNPESTAATLRILQEETDDAVLFPVVLGLPEAFAKHPEAFGQPRAGFDLDAPLPAAIRFWLAQAMLADGSAEGTRVGLEHYQRVLDALVSIPQSATPAVMRIANRLCAQAKDDPTREIAIRRQVAMLTPAAERSDGFAANGQPRSLAALNQLLQQHLGVADPTPAGDTIAQTPPLTHAVVRYLATRIRLNRIDDVRDDLDSMGVDPAHPTVALMLALLDRPRQLAAGDVVPDELVPLVDAIDDDTLCKVLTALHAHAGQTVLVEAISRRAMKRYDEQLAGPARGVKRQVTTELRRMRMGLVRLAIARDTGDAAARADAMQAAKTVVLVPSEGPQDPWESAFARGATDVLAYRFIDDVRSADANDDPAALALALDSLARISPLASGATLDAVYVLETHGRVAEADEVFGEHLDQARAAVDANPESPTTNNSIAWLCARAGRDLERAYQYAVRANALTPGMASLMDTQAEAAFRTNRVAEAVRLETAAYAQLRSPENMEGMGDDKFIETQLARFRAGLKPGDATRSLPSEHWFEVFE